MRKATTTFTRGPFRSTGRRWRPWRAPELDREVAWADNGAAQRNPEFDPGENGGIPYTAYAPGSNQLKE